MLDKIVKNVSELNAAAMHLRQSGGMEELRKLAKNWGIPYAQTEAYIQGKRYRLTEVPVADKAFKTPFEKLREEMIALDDKYFASIIAWYMIRKCEEDESLGEQVLKKHKSLQRCLDFVTGKAFAIATEQAKQKGLDHVTANTGLALTQNDVFPWVEEYYRNDDEAEVKKTETEEKEKILKEWEKWDGGLKKVTGVKKGSSKTKKRLRKRPKRQLQRLRQNRRSLLPRRKKKQKNRQRRKHSGRCHCLIWQDRRG